MNELNGKGAIVTGAASGIGLGIARVLARAGVNIALVDIQAAALDSLRNEIAALGVRAIAVPLDVSDREAVKAAAATIDRELGKVHLVFNNAGVELGGTAVEDVEDHEWDWIIGVSILAPAAVNTRIHASGSNRPVRFGGAYQRAGAEGLQAALASGLTPEEVGERVVRAILNNELYVFTHDAPKTWFSERFDRILAAFGRIGSRA